MAVGLTVTVAGETQVSVTTAPVLGTLHGMPVGGTVGQALVKASSTDFDATWQTVVGGGGSGAVESVNSVLPDINGDVLLTKSNIGLSAVPNVDATNASNISSGILNIGRVPTGTSGTTVALGNHGHGISEVTNLQTSLNSKAATGANSDITALNGLTTPISVLQGGTGTGAYNIGDILYASGSATLSKLSGVATGNSLVSGGAGAAPSWGKIGLTTHVSGTLPSANGGTGQSTFSVGDLLYASSSTALSKLTAVGTGNALISGGVGVAPSWGKVDLTTHISNTLPVANGGTGRTTSTTAYGLVAAGTTATGALQTIATGTSGQILKSNGSAALATFQTGAPTDVGLDASYATYTPATLPISSAVSSALFGKADSVHSHSATEVTSGILDIERAPAGATITVDYVKTTFGKSANSWPTTRPTSRTDISIIWKGPVDPGVLAIDGDDWSVTS